MDGDTALLPTIRIRGRSFMAMVVTPEPPFGAWFTAFDRQLAGLPHFFSDRPVVVDAGSARIDLLAMLAFSFLTWPFLASGHRLRRAEGGILLAAYLGYVVFLVA